MNVEFLDLVWNTLIQAFKNHQNQFKESFFKTSQRIQLEREFTKLLQFTMNESDKYDMNHVKLKVLEYIVHLQSLSPMQFLVRFL